MIRGCEDVIPGICQGGATLSAGPATQVSVQHPVRQNGDYNWNS